MYKDDYLSTKAIIQFIDWIESILDVPRSFNHSYHHIKENKRYTFENLFEAYKKYDWKRKHTIEELSITLKKSLIGLDEQACLNTCNMILEWGGVKNMGNIKRLSILSPNLCAYLLAIRERMAMNLPLQDYFTPEIHMTSGFSKIYSACVDEFIIYDSRVAASLGLLVRTFCINYKLQVIPHELKFAWSNGRGRKTRNPSFDGYSFPKIKIHKKNEYLENNIKANWLLSKITNSTKSKFASIEPHDHRLRALEKSLFMLGYDISQK
ncbi:MAG: hypothetical protein FWE90_10560 [Defluviitaleaceae bacterium]|nr:hypothetical protein [Defluviitaleaceae bacterium]